MSKWTMRRNLIGVVFSVLVGTAGLWSGVSLGHPSLIDPDVKIVEDAIQKAFPGVSLQNVQPAPMPGLYMFTMNNEDRVYFVDKTGRYLMVQAALFDTQTQKNLTQDFVFEHRRNIVANVSLENAVVYRPTSTESASPAHIVYLFDDPDCPYCREFHAEVKKLVAAGVTVAVFLHPVERIHKGATVKSQYIWCATDRAAALDLAMSGQPVPAPAQLCDSPSDGNLVLAKKLGGGPTPYLVFPDGRTLAGGKPATEIMRLLGMPPAVAQQSGQ